MKIHLISWLDEFKCLCGECPSNCCKGWKVPLDDDDRERFRNEKGLMGVELFFATGFGRRDHINAGAGRCFFLSRDGLCRIQKKKGSEFIPWACRHFPRFYRNYGEFEEICLDLSCVEVARLFLKHIDDMKWIESDGEAYTGPCSSNEDGEFLGFLLRIRTEMMDAIYREFCEQSSSSDMSVAKQCGNFAEVLYSFAEEIQDRVMLEQEGAYGKISFVTFFNERFQPDMKSRFYRGGDRLEGEIESVFTNNPGLLPVFGMYLSYYLMQYFLRTYETYSFCRQIGLGLCHTNHLMRKVLERARKRPLTDDVLAGVIAEYNRRYIFNEDRQEELYRELRYRI